MTANQSTAADSEATVLTLRQVAKAALTVLSQQTQTLQQYGKAASTQAAFILTEIEPEALGYREQGSDYACPVLYVANLRDILGSLIQISLLPAGSLSRLNSVDDILSLLPQVIAVTGTNGKTTISQLLAQLCQFSSVKQLQNSAVRGTPVKAQIHSACKECQSRLPSIPT